MENPEITQLKKIIEDKTKQELQEKIEALTKENEILKQMNGYKIGKYLGRAFEKIGLGLLKTVESMKEVPKGSAIESIIDMTIRSEDLKNKAIIKVLESLKEQAFAIALENSVEIREGYEIAIEQNIKKLKEIERGEYERK